MLIEASNDYKTVSRCIDVEFQNSSDGVRWYSVIVMLIVIGAAVVFSFLYFIRIKRKKSKSQAVSTYTDN
jgi:hypothetical protein